MTSRLGELGPQLAATREYSVCVQPVRVSAADPDTTEQMYAVVNDAHGVVEGRFATYPAALQSMLTLQESLNQARIACADKVTFYV